MCIRDSPYIDLRLPCGGGIDLLFTPRPSAATVAQALETLDARRAFSLMIGCDSIAPSTQTETGRWDGQHIVVDYQPPLRIAALGQGEDLTAFARLASAFGAEVLALTPDEATTTVLAAAGIAFAPLPTRNTLPPIATDPWSAILFLFHGRDWEEFLLPQALALPAFYHGAIGSRRTHAARLAALEDAGVPAERIATLRGHIGLIPATRDPATLALSILGEIVADYNALAHWQAWMGKPLAESVEG